MTYFMAGEGRRQYGQDRAVELRDQVAMSIPAAGRRLRESSRRGIFPMATTSGRSFPALVCGNTVVFKPATLTRSRRYTLSRILEEAGSPRRRSTLVTGGGAEVGNGDARDVAVRVVSFTARPRSAAPSRSRRPCSSRRCTSRWAARTSS